MKRLLIDKTLLRFLIVGVCNTIIGCGVMFALYNLAGCTYWVSSAANYVVGGTVSFFLNKYFTFQSRKWSWKQVWRFVVNLAVCYLLAYGMARPFIHMLLSGQTKNLQDNAAMLTGMCLYTVLNYLGQRLFAFRERDAG